MEKLNDALEKVKEQMTDPAVPVTEKQETTVAAKKVAKKKTNGAAKAVKKDQDSMMSLKALAAQLKIEPRLARIKLRKAEIKNPGRWAWEEGSGELTKVRKLLSKEE